MITEGCVEDRTASPASKKLVAMLCFDASHLARNVVREAAQRRGVSSHRIRKLIKAGILPAEQVVRGAPFQIRAADLDTPCVVEAAGRKVRPCHIAAANQLPMFQILEEEVHNEPGVALRRIRRVDSAVVTLFDLSSARLMVNVTARSSGSG